MGNLQLPIDLLWEEVGGNPCRHGKESTQKGPNHCTTMLLMFPADGFQKENHIERFELNAKDGYMGLQDKTSD